MRRMGEEEDRDREEAVTTEDSHSTFAAAGGVAVHTHPAGYASVGEGEVDDVVLAYPPNPPLSIRHHSLTHVPPQHHHAHPLSSVSVQQQTSVPQQSSEDKYLTPHEAAGNAVANPTPPKVGNPPPAAILKKGRPRYVCARMAGSLCACVRVCVCVFVCAPITKEVLF
jgi:hypothetical protein